MLRIITCFTIFLQIISYDSFAQFAVESIPADLKENAHCIVREYFHTIEVKSVNTSSEQIKKVITVLDRTGEDYAYLALPYDKNSTVSIDKIVIYDKNGNRTKNIRISDVQDHPFSGTTDLYSDNRIKVYYPKNPTFPYTIEYDYNKNSRNVISYGCWKPFTTYNTSIQNAKLVLIHPSKLNINVKEFDIRQKTSETNKNQQIKTWELNNIEALEEEPFGVDITERIPRVYLMPEILLFDNYQGSSKDWKEFGKWMFKLYEGRDILPDDEKDKVNAILKSKTDTLDYIRILYEYLQRKTRYVSITLGIGGFQPSDVKNVLETGYGDCKALSNYMHSLLKFIGVKSFPALVASGSYPVNIISDFPNFQQFDHVILCVPFRSDTIWLECTNPIIPFGFLGDFTDDRKTLLITEDGGKFANTIRYDANDNRRICNSKINIDADGTASIKTETSFYGLQYDDLSEVFNLGYEGQKKWLAQKSEFPSYTISTFSIKEDRDLLPSAYIYEEGLSKNYCTLSGKYLILPLNRMNFQKPVRRMLKQRYSDIVINKSFTDFDTLTFTYPNNYIIESLPQGGKIVSVFGEYSSTVDLINNSLIYTRKLKINKARYKASDYTDFYNFILDISKNDDIKVLLNKR